MSKKPAQNEHFYRFLLRAVNPFTVIVHLNNHHRWSREAIADWIQALEAKLDIKDSQPLSKQEEEEEFAKAKAHPSLQKLALRKNLERCSSVAHFEKLIIEPPAWPTGHFRPKWAKSRAWLWK